MTTPKLYPCLWFDGQAEEAAKFYTGIFKNSKTRRFHGTGRPAARCTANRRERS